jgi:hypothetical protein
LVVQSRALSNCIAGCLAAAWLLLGGNTQAIAQESDTASRTERLEAMRARAAELAAQVVPHEKPRKIEPTADALLRFNDATRDFHDGTLWAYCDFGRPCCLASIERYEKFWSYELISLTELPLAVKVGEWTWRPQDSVVFQPIAKAAAPEKSAEARQRQARTLARRFSAVEFLGEEQERIELRLQPRPIFTYESPRYNVLTGALFVLSNGTNPEVLLVLEAAAQEGDEHWRYAFARISTAALEASLDGERVWRVDHSRQPKNQTDYSYLSVPIESTPEKVPRAAP